MRIVQTASLSLTAGSTNSWSIPPRPSSRSPSARAKASARYIDTRKARIVLIEAGPRVLAGFAENLSDYARRSLVRLGVEVVLGEPVTECTAAGVVYGGKTLAAATIIWAAGVRASPAAQWLGAPAAKSSLSSSEVALSPRFGLSISWSGKRNFVGRDWRAISAAECGRTAGIRFADRDTPH